jgi:hypothetical protein
MIKRNELIGMRAIALCFKPFLKPEEPPIYCSLGRTQFARSASNSGYEMTQDIIKREEIDNAQWRYST